MMVESTTTRISRSSVKYYTQLVANNKKGQKGSEVTRRRGEKGVTRRRGPSRYLRSNLSGDLLEFSLLVEFEVPPRPGGVVLTHSHIVELARAARHVRHRLFLELLPELFLLLGAYVGLRGSLSALLNAENGRKGPRTWPGTSN